MTGPWNAAPQLTFHVNSDTPLPKHKIRREVHDPDRHITEKDTNPFSEYDGIFHLIGRYSFTEATEIQNLGITLWRGQNIQ